LSSKNKEEYKRERTVIQEKGWSPKNQPYIKKKAELGKLIENVMTKGGTLKGKARGERRERKAGIPEFNKAISRIETPKKVISATSQRKTEPRR